MNKLINNDKAAIDQIKDNKEQITEIRRQVFSYGADIIKSDRFKKAKRVQHHINYNVAVHSVEVAMYALLIVRCLKKHHLAKRLDERDLVRAALLHDIGMTNDAVHGSPSYKKAFSHPREGFRIARDEFHLNKAQLKAIKYHMWPVGIIPPSNVIGWILTTADNMSSFNEGMSMLRNKFRHNKKTGGERNE